MKPDACSEEQREVRVAGSRWVPPGNVTLCPIGVPHGDGACVTFPLDRLSIRAVASPRYCPSIWPGRPVVGAGRDSQRRGSLLSALAREGSGGKVMGAH